MKNSKWEQCISAGTRSRETAFVQQKFLREIYFPKREMFHPKRIISLISCSYKGGSTAILSKINIALVAFLGTSFRPNS